MQGLRPYSRYKAAGLRLLQSIRKGEYSKTDVYWVHAPLSKDERADVLMITDRSVKQISLLESEIVVERAGYAHIS